MGDVLDINIKITQPTQKTMFFFKELCNWCFSHHMNGRIVKFTYICVVPTTIQYFNI